MATDAAWADAVRALPKQTLFEQRAIVCDANRELFTTSSALKELESCTASLTDGADGSVCTLATREKLERLYKAAGIVRTSLPALADQALARGPFRAPGVIQALQGQPAVEANLAMWADQINGLRKQADSALNNIMVNSFAVMANMDGAVDTERLTDLEAAIKDARTALSRLQRNS